MLMGMPTAYNTVSRIASDEFMVSLICKTYCKRLQTFLYQRRLYSLLGCRSGYLAPKGAQISALTKQLTGTQAQAAANGCAP
jgi:hypothetical protein